jgi:DNA mismatch endonuclease (patch repair protein)
MHANPVSVIEGGTDARRPAASSPAVSARMSIHPRRNTGPEVAVRRIVHACGLRYRLNAPVPGQSRRTIDIAFPGDKVAVFIDGCFWHGCFEHRPLPRANREWWAQKIALNRRRDDETVAHLRELGWVALRYWEHEKPDVVADRIVRVVRSRRGARR